MTPTRIAGNPVIAFGGASWEASQVQEPAVFVDPADATKLIMFYAGMKAPVATGVMAIGRATADVSNPTVWTQYASNPIFTAGGTSIRLDSMQLVGGVWYLYYTDPAAGTINLATSTDGFTFTAYAGNPVLSPTGQGCTDGSVVSQGAVLYDSGTWRMYYSYRDSGATLPGIRYAFSSDGMTWTKQLCSNMISVGPAGSSDSTYIEWHQITKINGYYILSYEAYDGTRWTENIAYSPLPGSQWKKSLANPVFTPSNVAATWDQNHVATPGYFQIGSSWYLFYQGTAAAQGGSSYSFGNWSLGIATLPPGNDPTSAIP